MPPTIKPLLISFVVLWVVFRLLELFQPKTRRLPVLRRGLLTDCAYWMFTPLITRAVTAFGLAAAAIPISLAIHGQVSRDLIMQGYGPLSRLPLGAQAAGILLVSDFTGYWMHRAFHRGKLWPFHAVHHSSTDLDWLSAVRLHPINDVMMRAATTIPVLLFGFAPAALAGALPVLALFAILVHANVDWDFGRLRVVIASPRFHRWHHTDELAARDKNFAGLLPVWDILFGTYYMPRGERPARFGTAAPVPTGLIGQLIFPFRRTSSQKSIELSQE
jgi:sterol desaturase/sphingolipid hydroxylase (fatty acid hydroxylase superfamily)